MLAMSILTRKFFSQCMLDYTGFTVITKFNERERERERKMEMSISIFLNSNIFFILQVGCKVLVAAEEFKGQSYYEMLFHLVPELANTKSAHIKSHL